MYELGLRHALSNGATLLVMGSGSRLPFDVSLARVILYNVDESGSLIEEDTGRRYLAEAIRQGVGRAGSDSPVYAFFPSFALKCQSELARGGRKPRTMPRETVQGGTLPPGMPSPASLKQAEEEIKTSKDVDPASVLEVLKGYQVNSAWKDLVQFASELPPELRNMPQVQQMAALALNRLGQQKEAVAMIRSLITKTGEDSDSYGILGRIYKDLYARDQKREDLEEAIRNYRSAFKLAPNDYYSGMNLVSLLVIYGGDEAQNELSELVPRLRYQLGQRVADPRADYWDFASAIELAVIARDWPAALDLQQRMLKEPRADWMLQTTANSLHALGKFWEKRIRCNWRGWSPPQGEAHQCLTSIILLQL